MDLLHDNIKKLYGHYLAAAIGSAMITSVYSMADSAIIGQYQGPDGTAALAVVSPLWNIMYSLGLLMGIGGSVLLSSARGSGEGEKESNRYFTLALEGTLILSVLVMVIMFVWKEPILRAFGADGTMLELAKTYLFSVNFAVPAFLLSQMLAAFLRNDGAPRLAAVAVLCGGVLNVVGDLLLVFVLDMGISGAGLATAVGSVLSVLVMLTHFRNPACTLRLVPPKRRKQSLSRIVRIGFPSFVTDVAMGILTICFNRQIIRTLGTNELAVYGVIISVSTFVQCCAYSVGQAAQPIISTNYGAGDTLRVKQTLRLSLGTVAAFALLWTAISELTPLTYVRFFMSPTQDVLKIAPAIIRTYALSFLLLPLNVFSTYYFQAILRTKTAFWISIARGILLSGALVFLLPAVWGADAIWLAMPITETVVAIFTIGTMLKARRSI